MKAERLVACQNILGEGPLWSAEEKALYWVDITGRKIHKLIPESKKKEVYPMPKRIGAIGVREKGGFVCCAEDGFYFIEPTTGQMEFITNPEPDKPDARFNDGKVDRGGRFWAGTMTPRGASSALYMLDANLKGHRMLSDITISNGIGWSPDNATMYYADSNRYVIHAFDFDITSGTIENQRDFLRLGGKSGVPDGLTVDSAGFVWCAIYDGWKVICLDPSGKIAGEIKLPVARPSSVAFGGKELDMLFITSISEGLSEQEKALQPMAGDLFAVSPGVKGLPEPKFTG